MQSHSTTHRPIAARALAAGGEGLCLWEPLMEQSRYLRTTPFRHGRLSVGQRAKIRHAFVFSVVFGSLAGFCYPAIPQQAGSLPPGSTPPAVVAPPSSVAPSPPASGAPAALPPAATAPEAVPSAPAAAADDQDRDPATGLTQQEWNRTAVQDVPRLEPQSGHPPKPTATDKRDIYPRSTGYMLVQDDPDADRVYPVDCLVSHCTVFQVPGTVVKAWCGDLQAWKLEGGASFVSVKPLGADLSTNLQILTDTNRLYTFRLWSHQDGQYTDVFRISSAQGYIADQQALEAQRLAKMREQLAKENDAKLKEALDKAQFNWTRNFAENVEYQYKVEQPSDGSFRISGIFSDATFTYFHVQGDEKPTIFLETKTGGHWTRELINFDITNQDFYRVQKILVGNQRFILKLRATEATIKRGRD